MAKINKYANIYDKDGNLIRHVGEDGRLHNYTIDELEKLVDELTEKVKENPEDEELKRQLNNVNTVLFQSYNSMSRADLMKRMTILQEAANNAQSEAAEQEKAVLDKVNEEIDKLKSSIEEPVEEEKPTIMDEYVQFEEVKDE